MYVYVHVMLLWICRGAHTEVAILKDRIINKNTPYMKANWVKYDILKIREIVNDRGDILGDN